MTPDRSNIRCAIYTRKSSEEGLDQSLNSLHAQWEVCEAYVLSQRHEGWQLLAASQDKVSTTDPDSTYATKGEKERYYTGQLVDLYTFNFAYFGTRSFGNDGGNFLIAGPNWQGETPAGIKAVLRAQTQFAYPLIRTELFNAADIDNVRKIQSGYHAKPLSTFLHQPEPPAAPAVNWPRPTPDMMTTPAIFSYVNFILQFCPTDPWRSTSWPASPKSTSAPEKPSISPASRQPSSKPAPTPKLTSTE